ncbi:MAG: IS66 family transposase, partial [Acetobacteraceae bacterium]|nr:IS66 family transposase [Acetobacteraceae bacterium]
MSLDPAALPRDPDRLIEMIVALQDENSRLHGMLEAIRRTLYGARSERFEADAAQLALDLQDTSTAPIEPPPATPAPYDQPVRPKPTRNIGSLPKHLPREDVIIEPSIDSCPCCQGKLHRIGEDVSEMLDVVPAVIRVKRIRRPRYGCRACESTVVQAPAPPRPVEGGLPTSALLAHIAVSKFAWHLPLYRQAQMLAGQGIELDRSTLVRWIERAAWWLQPLHGLLVSTVMSAPKVFCDDTPLPVLDRTRRRTRIARLWCYAVDDRSWQGPAKPAVVFRYAEDRRGRHVKEHLEDFHGVLQVDGYAGYGQLAEVDRPGGAITLAFCLAHARRQFFEVHKQTADPVAAEALRRIGEVYAIEARIRGLTAAERVAVRQSETKPLLAALRPWLLERLGEISAKSSLAGAIRYTLGHWEGLTLFLADGRIEVDSNTVERCIRPIPMAGSLCTSSLSPWEHWKCVRVVNATR